MNWENLAEGTVAVFDFRISPENMKAFLALSGDTNPLHWDDAFARAAGFEGPVVYGALIVAKISQLIGVHLPGTGGVWAGLKIDFRAPLYVGEDARLTGTVSHRSEATRMLSLNIRVDAGERCIATGSAETIIVGNG